MQQPSKRFDLWRRMYNRFLIEPLPAQLGVAPAVSTLVQPITDADEFLLSRRVVRDDFAVAATGDVIIYTVPSDRRAILHSIWALQQTGTFTFNAFNVNDGTLAHRIDVFTTTSERVLNVSPLKLDSGWTVVVEVDVHSGAGNLIGSVLVEEEDAF